MISELTFVIVSLDAFIDVLAVYYWASNGYFRRPRRNGPIDSVAPVESYAAPREQPVGGPIAVATTAAEPAPSPVLAIYETVQPAPAPVQYVAPTSTSFGAPSISMSTKSYRRRPAPVGSTATKSSLKQKTKKRSAREEG